MQKDRFKKVMVILLIGIVMMIVPFVLTGCSDIQLNDDTVTIIKDAEIKISDLEQTVDELKEMLERNNFTTTSLNDTVNELKEMLEKEIEKNSSKNSSEIIKQSLVKDLINLVELSVGHNYTYNHTSSYNKNTITYRVEYISNDLSKTYYYELNDECKIEKEIYREITNFSITTYVNDGKLKLYSTIPISKTKELNVYNFDSDLDLALEKLALDKYVAWSDVSDINVYHDFDAISNIYKYFSSVAKMDLEDFKNLFFEFEEKEKENIYTGWGCELYNGDEEYDQVLEVIKERYAISENSLKATTIYKEIYEPGVYNGGYIQEYIFDIENENKIEFDKNGYLLVSDYLASL